MEKDKVSYRIPSKIYPLSDSKDFKIFNPDNTSEYDNRKISDILDTLDLPMGRCYTNSKRIQEAFLAHRIESSYYSGWLFNSGDLPIHHAWLVLEVDNNTHIIDSAFHVPIYLAAEEMNKLPGNITDREIQRKRFVQFYKEFERTHPKNSQRMINGKVLTPMLYVGSRDNSQDAIQRYNKLMRVFHTHPSYPDGSGKNGRSRTQEIYLEKEER